MTPATNKTNQKNNLRIYQTLFETKKNPPIVDISTILPVAKKLKIDFRQKTSKKQVLLDLS